MNVKKERRTGQTDARREKENKLNGKNTYNQSHIQI
jgi:hypothetical protein